MRKFVLFLGLVLLLFETYAQQLVVTGKVFDSKTLQAIANVQVFDTESKTGTTTGDDGTFLIKIPGNKNAILTFSHISYFSYTKKFERGKRYESQKVLLEPKIEELIEVEIMGVSVEDKPYRTENIDLHTIRKTNLQGVGNLLRNLPNVSGVRKGAMGIDPVLRGFKYSQLNVQVNGGTRIEGGCPNRMDPATVHVDLNDVKNITILKGPFALKYGVNFGGVIDLTTYRPEFYQKYVTKVNAIMSGQTNHSGFKTRVGVTGGNRFVNYVVSGSWKKYGDYKAGNNNWVPASLQQQTYSGNVAFKLAKKHVIYADVNIEQGKNVDFPTLTMDERKDDTKIFSLNYLGNNLGKSVNFIRFKAYFSNVHHEMDNKNRPFSDTLVAVSKIHASTMGGKLGVNINAGKARLEVGSDYENIKKDGERLKSLIMQPILPQKEEDLWNDAQINNLGLFAEYNHPGSTIDWVVAARLDFNSASSDPLRRNNMAGDAVYLNDSTGSQYLNFSLSGGLTWHVNKHDDLVISLGRGARSPDITERFIILLPIGYDPYDYLGNPQLKPEVNHELDVGYRYIGRNIGNMDFSIFFSYVANYITGVLLPPSVVKPQTKGVLGVKQFVNIDDAFMSGFELTYNTPQKYLWGVMFNAAYTLGWNPDATVYVVEGGEVVGEKTVRNDPLPEIPPFEMNLAFNYQFFQRRFVPVVSLRIAAAQNRVSQAYNEQASPGFAIVNFNLEYRFSRNFTVYAGVRNIFNKAYYEHLNRNIIGTTYPLYEPGRIFYTNLIFNL